MKNIQKLVIAVAAFIGFSTLAQSAQTGVSTDDLGWDRPVLSGWNINGFDIVISQTNVTSAQLGGSNNIPNLAGIVGKTRVANITTVNISTVAPGVATGNYLFWARTVASPTAQTNIYVSSWTNSPLTILTIPTPPTNLRVINVVQ